MNMTALKTWMIAGAIALGGGTAALATSDVELSAPEGVVLQEGGNNFQLNVNNTNGEGVARRGGPRGQAGQSLGLSEEARTFLRDEVKAVTATTLGVTVEELEAADREARAAILEASGLAREDVQAAVESAWPGIVQEAADSGLITAEQATALEEAGPRIGGERGRRGGQRGNRGGNLGFLPQETRAEIVAEGLGITVEELEAYRAEGLNMGEIIETLGLEREAVREATQDATIAAVEQAAADGTITQEQADTFIEMLGVREIARDIRQQATLDVLGITAEELEAYKESGLDRSEVLAELGLEAETVRADIQTAVEELVQEAVNDGTLTEEQAELILNGRGRGNRGPGGPNGNNGPAETGNNA